MAEGTIQLPPDSTGKILRTQSNAGVASGAHQQVGSLAGTDGTLVTSRVVGSSGALDVNLVATQSAYTPTAQVISAASTNVAATASTTAMAVAGVAAAGNATVTMNTSAFVGTLTFEASDDGGTTYFPIAAAREDGTGQDSTVPYTITTLYQRIWIVALPGVSYFRVRCSAFTSGTATIRISPGPMLVEPNPITLAMPADSNKATYSAGHVTGGGFTSALTGGAPVWRLLGSATRVVKLTRLEIGLTVGGTSPTGGSPLLLRKATASTVGTTSAATTTGPLDTIDPAATAVSVGYTAAPTAGTVTSIIRQQRFVMSATTFFWAWDFGQGRPSKCPTIRGTNEEIHATLLTTVGGTTPTVTWSIVVEWTEESF